MAPAPEFGFPVPSSLPPAVWNALPWLKDPHPRPLHVAWLTLFLQSIFLTQESNLRLLCLLHWLVNSLPLSHLGSPSICVHLASFVYCLSWPLDCKLHLCRCLSHILLLLFTAEPKEHKQCLALGRYPINIS